MDEACALKTGKFFDKKQIQEFAVHDLKLAKKVRVKTTRKTNTKTKSVSHAVEKSYFF